MLIIHKGWRFTDNLVPLDLLMQMLLTDLENVMMKSKHMTDFLAFFSVRDIVSQVAVT